MQRAVTRHWLYAWGIGNPLFTGQGHFSQINARLRAALQRELGAMSWYDAREVLDTPTGLTLGLSAAAMRRPAFLLEPRRLFHARVKTTPTFGLMSRAVTREAKRIDAPYVFQTQSLFDGHVDAKPLFVYTDYTERANLRDRPRHQLMPARWLRRELMLYETADLIFAASSTAQQSLIEDYGVPADKVILTHTGINVEAPHHVPERSGDAFNILFVGMDWERKGGPDVLRAFDRLRTEFPTATLTIVGGKHGLRPARGVRYVGKAALEELPAYLAAASVFCLPAHHEPAGIAYSEASAWGLPVVASTAGNISDRILTERTGLLVSPGDVEALAGALLRLARDPSLRLELGRTGRDYTLANFTWRSVAAKIAAAIRPRLGLDSRPAMSPVTPLCPP
jgi:glycosyltransferase involved in cell wall biosynthesis